MKKFVTFVLLTMLCCCITLPSYAFIVEERIKPPCQEHQCAHPVPYLQPQSSSEWDRYDDTFHGYFKQSNWGCRVCYCLASYRIEVEKLEAHSYPSSPITSTTIIEKNASNHWTYAKETYDCTRCSQQKTQNTSPVYEDHYYTGTKWMDGGHPPTSEYHNYYVNCSKCGYRFETMQIKCPGNTTGIHASVIYSYEPPLVSQ